ncbi:hypothetical protein AXE80_02910 [Wenyingzhuangia fucanilytica]|uniref:CBM-cenC domain-containing protein n=1 Tax=Wenyingzhuangia fucanilytica TaxID=1790137 RepID=A0A1B1Y3J0_9FLAO|nr:hypothetical protein [Wenyingzhuangia fucanilytica]ANW95299.1 hypothetical protein AXE80_02910 [Wenyingzhuangia fucanilytica]
MKKVLFVVTVIVFSVTGVTAQEVQESFEKGSKGWWTPSKQVWSVSNDKASEGKSSLKFNCSQFPEGAKGIKYQNVGMKLSAGTYKITAKVFVEENSKVTGFSIATMKPFKTVSIKFTKLAKGEWVDVEQEITLEKDASNVVINVSSNPKWGGTGTFYLDDLKFIKS